MLQSDVAILKRENKREKKGTEKVLTLLHIKYIQGTKCLFFRQCLHDSDNPTTQELEKEQSNAQLPIPTHKTIIKIL